MAGRVDEVPVSFRSEQMDLIGLLHMPDPSPSLGVVIVVGGPQYRAGSHRQFVLLARDLASNGAAVLRFDCRGMGDSGGNFPGFERIGPDIAAAVDFIQSRIPSMRRLILWGLCDAVPAICAHACHDPRISGVVIVNPWVRTESGHARAKLKYYYLKRVLEASFLGKVLRGRVHPFKSIRELCANIALGSRKDGGVPHAGHSHTNGSLAETMAEDLRRYHGSILLIMSGRDLTAREFDDTAHRSRTWRMLLSDRRLTRCDLTEADHTFSRREWQDKVFGSTWDWIKALE